MPADKYVNKAYVSVTESAAGTLTFGELETGVSLFDKQGWLIQRIEYYIDNDVVGDLVGGSDSLYCAITLSNKVSALNLSDAAVVDLLKINVAAMGTPATGQWIMSPIVKDFTGLTGGGQLVPPRPLYLAVQSGGFVSAAKMSCRFLFTVVEMKADEYWELVEAYRLVE